jgi:hypothetical protein
LELPVIGVIEIRKRLKAAIERQGMSPDQERFSVPMLNAVVPEVLRMISEELRKAKRDDL